MKFCYIDESGTGDEPYAVMVGIIVDAMRMRPTKSDWDILLRELEAIVGRPIQEIHTRQFYAGNGPWRELDGPRRAAIIDSIIGWLTSRKHSLVYAAVEKVRFQAEFQSDPRYQDIQTLWRFLGLHLILSIQKQNQRFEKNKGNSVLVFDNEERERVGFTDLIQNPPEWTDSYYNRGPRQERLDQIIDVPYFADSKDVPLLQVADFVAYFIRRFIELESGAPGRYANERSQVQQWVSMILEQAISRASIYPRRQRCPCAELFYSFAPLAIRN